MSPDRKDDADVRQKKLKKQIVGIAKVYGHRQFSEKSIRPGVDYIPVSGTIRTGEDIANVVDAGLDGWWTEGRWVAEFERKLREFYADRRVVMVNSGSSANLIALAALMEIHDLKPGQEIITTALAFPTTVNPIVQLGFVPRFVDVQLGTYVPTIKAIKNAINDKTAAIMMAHTLGNPWPVKNFAGKLPIIEDNCDAFGSYMKGGSLTGTVGDFGTLSFYPAHHLTSGEGGAIICRKKSYEKIVRSLRDWGRECWCPTGTENTCGKRFDWEFAGLPKGYDHKYVYSRIGWNLKPTDLQAAIGVSQIENVNEFILARRRNFDYMSMQFRNKGLQNVFVMPKESRFTKTSWFGFPLTLKMGASFTVTDLSRVLEKTYHIGTRRMFAGNILAQPAYRDIKYKADDLTNTLVASNHSFWIGIWPRITNEVIDYMTDSIVDAVELLGGIK